MIDLDYRTMILERLEHAAEAAKHLHGNTPGELRAILDIVGDIAFVRELIQPGSVKVGTYLMTTYEPLAEDVARRYQFNNGSNHAAE